MKWLDKSGWYGLDIVTVIEFQPKDFSYRVLVMGNRKKSFLIIEKQIFDSQIELETWLSKYPLIPIILDFSNVPSISKLVKEDEQNFVSAIMGVKVDKPNKFILQIQPGKNKMVWASILREEKLDEVYRFISKDQIIYQNLNKATTAFLFPLMDDYDTNASYCTEDYENVLWWNDGLIMPTQNNVNSFSLEELSKKIEIDAEWLSLFGIGAYYYLIEDHGGLSGNAFEKAKKTYQKLKFGSRLAGVGLLIGVLLLLIGLISEQYFSYQWTQSSSIIAQNQDRLEELQANQSEISNLSSFLNEFEEKRSGNGKLTYLLDQVASQIPKEILLNNLYFRPSSTKVKKLDNALKGENLDLILKGESQNSGAISQLAIYLHKLPLIEKAELFSNQFHYETGSHHFIIILQLTQR